MSIFSDISDSAGAKPPRCPKCESDAIAHYRHPTTNEPVCAEGLHLARCTSCEHVFGISEWAERYIPADDRIGATIEGELHCPTCKYNLKSLRFGAICPECGTPIPPSKGAIKAKHHGGLQAIPKWQSSLFFAIAMLDMILVLGWPQIFGGEVFLAGIGLGLLICGVHGIRDRNMTLDSHAGLTTVKGGFALFWGISHVGLGVVLIVLAVLMYLTF